MFKLEDQKIKRIKQTHIDPCEGCIFLDSGLECGLEKRQTDHGGTFACVDINYVTNKVTEYIWVEDK